MGSCFEVWLTVFDPRIEGVVLLDHGVSRGAVVQEFC